MDDDGAFHELRVFEQERAHLVAGDVVGRVEAELAEAFVLADEIGGRAGEQGEYVRQGGAIEWRLQVLDDVARDVALAQDVQRAARLPSAGVVVDRHAFHRLSLAGIPWAGYCAKRGPLGGAEHRPPEQQGGVPTRSVTAK